ncbi:MAG TPA: NYN domain-containing protein [Candidatus Thermoplasmatota archaeon]|nr:NYN domain-containing protein [Candidatus Thermoplasmatota archaeon]
MDPQPALLRFRLQEDGRRVSRLPSGKVVLVSLEQMDEVHDGEWWWVELDDRDTFAIAHLLSKGEAPVEEPAPAAAPGAPKAATSVTVKPAPVRKSTTPLFPTLRPGEALPEPNDVLRRTDRVALFVDSGNIGGAARDMGFFVDWKKAIEYFTDPGTFYAAFFYLGVTADDPAQGSFMDFLAHAGYIIKGKNVKRIVDRETGEERFKANLDVEIALDMMDTLHNYDVAFLFSGDSDFGRAVELLRSRGKRVYVVAPKTALSREMAAIADKPLFILDNYRGVLARKDRMPGDPRE